MSKVVITGGAGFVGAHTALELRSTGYETLILDNLSNGFLDQTMGAPFVNGDIRDKPALEALFKANPDITGVLHFAGLIEAGRSVREQDLFYDVNVEGTRTLLSVMKHNKITKLVFSSTAAVYGNPQTRIITENHPLSPVNPYGATKKECERLIHEAHQIWGLRSVILRYFNAAGSDPDTRIGERHNPETHLIPLIIDTVLGRRPPLQIYGTDYDTPDRTCIRDYVHVHDLATAHICALEKLNEARQGCLIYNLGTMTGFSVLDVIDAAQTVLGQPVPFTYAPRRAGDPARLICSNEKAQLDLGWTIQYPNLTDMIQHCYDFRKTL